MYEKINQINILIVLDKVGIQYKNLGSGTYGIILDGKITNGRRVNKINNYIYDFSGKGRPNGPPFVFVKKYLNLTNRETYKRFEQNFYIKNEIIYPKNKGSPKQKNNKVVEPYCRKRLKQ